MQTLEALRRQIETATDLRSVVSTMKTLAAVSIRQYEEAAAALSEYRRTIELGFQIVLRHGALRFESNDLAGDRGAIVFGSDQGMCGQFNERIVEYLNVTVESDPGAEPRVLLVAGARVGDQLRDARWPTDSSYEMPASVSDIGNLVQEMLPRVQQLREKAGISRWDIYYNRRVSGSTYTPTWMQLLPLDPRRVESWRDTPWSSCSLPTFVTDRRSLLSRLVQHELFVSLFQACAESLASENASRIAAMQAAEKNIEERLEDLRSAFNQRRQSEITEELLDVVTGFEALSQNQQSP